MEIDKITTEFSVKFKSLEISIDEVVEYLQWIAENNDGIEKFNMFWYPKNIKGKVTSDVEFRDETAAMAFKLRWL